jgi:hypothetical protein
MRTAIFVYQPTLIKISTSESDLQLCRMDADTVPLSAGENARTIVPGIYKIVSSQEVLVAGDSSAFDIIVAFNKTDIPPPPPSRATTSFAPLDASAVEAFLTIAEAKAVVNP